MSIFSVLGSLFGCGNCINTLSVADIVGTSEYSNIMSQLRQKSIDNCYEHYKHLAHLSRVNGVLSQSFLDDVSYDYSWLTRAPYKAIDLPSGIFWDRTGGRTWRVTIRRDPEVVFVRDLSGLGMIKQ